ncbi:ATP-binding cassette sub- D member 4 [Haplosporangium sp. Z 767]|nr:ATP-binding cassette sub- D member 4 [Haplosporangium sp. Z 767]
MFSWRSKSSSNYLSVHRTAVSILAYVKHVCSAEAKGINNRVRRRFKSQIAMLKIGYDNNKLTRHLLPSRLERRRVSHVTRTSMNKHTPPLPDIPTPLLLAHYFRLPTLSTSAMYRLIPTEDEARDEDRTEIGSIRGQHGFVPESEPPSKGPFRPFFQKVKSLFSPGHRSRASECSWRSRSTARTPGAPGNQSTAPKRKHEFLLDRVFMKRFWRILQAMFEKPSKVPWLYIGLTLFCCVNEGVVYYVGTIPSRYYKVLGDKDTVAFFRLLIVSLLTVFLAGFGKTVIYYLVNLLALEGRRSLTLHFHQIYIQPKLFYRILMMHEEEVDNPDQRITQDIDKLTVSLGKIVEDLAIIPLLIGFYTWQCWQMAGYIGPLCIYGYFIFSSITSRFLINPIVDAVFYKESAEGYFRYLHVRFRQFAESITFSRGEDEAKQSADESFDVLLLTQLDVIYKELPLKFMQQSVSYFGSILSYVIIAIPIFMGKYDDYPSSDVSAVISKISFVSMYLTYQFSKVIQCGTGLSDVAGYTSRLGQLMEALDGLNAELENIAIDFPHEESMSMDTSIRFENVSFDAPAGDLIISNFTHRFEAGVNTMIVGPNGAGKTSILRAMGGLWPVAKGEVILPRRDVMFLPQTPYLTYGTLREQLVYPHKKTALSVSDADVVKVLKLARLEHIADMIEDFDMTYTLDWSKMLSPGEQQKMAFARLFYARPLFGVLDEATSSMDAESESEMFKQCRLLNITCITVCHHSSLEQYHQEKIALDGRGGWSRFEIQHSSGCHSDDIPVSAASVGAVSSEEMEADTLAGNAEDLNQGH